MISMQPTMQSQDELAALFSRNLTFNPEVQAPPQEVPRHFDPSATQNIVYSISQHYHHSTHIPKPADAQEEPQRPSSEPPQGNAIDAENMLRIHGINPATLTPSQLQLFRVAETSQQRRLLELWSICPPNNGVEIPSLAWSSTTVEQEEELAWMRFQRQQEQQVTSLDGTTVQTSTGQWHSTNESEPYMNSGYEELMRREREKQQSYSRATDPVYQGPDYARQQQELRMATQYGAHQGFHGIGQMDAMDVM